MQVAAQYGWRYAVSACRRWSGEEGKSNGVSMAMHQLIWWCQRMLRWGACSQYFRVVMLVDKF